MRSLLALAMVPGLALAQRVVDPDAPWKLEKPGMSLSREFGIVPLAPGPPIQAGEFVRRAGSVLTLGGNPYRFNGNNVYYNQADIVYGRQAGVEETLDKMAGLGMTVVRSNAHNDNVQSSDPAAIQLQPGVYSESSLVALDRSIALAKARNIRLILKLTNNWDAYGGIRRYVAWQLGRVPVQSEWGLFYSNDTIKAWFKNYVRMIIERKNTVTGITYRDEPAILAWELGNELRNPSVGGADALVQWTGEMATYIKQLDGNHLVADGGEGFDDDASLYPGMSNFYPVRGSEGCSFHRLVQLADLDMVSYHLYPAGWGINDGSDTAIYIRRHEEIARDAGKVAYFGEYGKRAADQSPGGCNLAPGRAFDAQRAQVYQAWLGYSAIEQATSGAMVWQLINDGKDDCEGFQVYCPLDAQSCDVLRQMSDRIAASPVAVSAATYQPVTMAAGSIATLFGIDLERHALVLVDGKGRTYDATIFFSSAGQINFQIPENMPLGGAVIRVVRDGTTRASNAMMVADGGTWSVYRGRRRKRARGGTGGCGGQGWSAANSVSDDTDRHSGRGYRSAVAVRYRDAGEQSVGYGEGAGGGSAVCGSAGGICGTGSGEHTVAGWFERQRRGGCGTHRRREEGQRGAGGDPVRFSSIPVRQ